MIFERITPYQRIVITRWKDDLRLFLNAHLQFSSRDEYRYHEALVHPGLSALPNARRALVLGGGDGLAVRELLKYPNLESITLVDLDPEMTEAVHRKSDARAAQRSFIQQSARARHPRRRVRVARSRAGILGFRGGRFSGPNQLFAGQAVHHHVLPAAAQACERKRPGGDSEHVADVLSPILLVHRGYAETGRIPHLAVSRLCSELRRVGIHAGRKFVGASVVAAPGLALFDRGARFHRYSIFRKT